MMKMKKIVLWSLLFLVPTLVLADMYIEEEFYAATGDIYANLGFYSNNGSTSYNVTTSGGGDVYITEDVADTIIMNEYVERGGGGVDYDTVVARLPSMFMVYKSANNEGWQYVEPESLRKRAQARFRWVFDTYFVPRFELMNLINVQQQQIQYLNYELESVKKLLDEDLLCDAKILVAREHNLSKVECMGTTYYTNQPQIVGLSVVVPTVDVNNTENTSEVGGDGVIIPPLNISLVPANGSMWMNASFLVLMPGLNLTNVTETNEIDINSTYINSSITTEVVNNEENSSTNSSLDAS